MAKKKTRQYRNKPEKNPSNSELKKLEVPERWKSLEEALTEPRLGEPILKPLVPKLVLKNPIKCPWCLGTGQSYGRACPKCKGAKEIEFY